MIIYILYYYIYIIVYIIKLYILLLNEAYIYIYTQFTSTAEDKINTSERVLCAYIDVQSYTLKKSLKCLANVL